MLPVEKIEIPEGDRSGEVAPLNDELGENSPNFTSVATMVGLDVDCHGVCSFQFINMGVKIPLTMI